MLKTNTKDVINCAVCNEIASGIHYGVSTCEGCKGFFRRIITTCASDNNTLNCSGPLRNQCTVTFRVRNLCQRCRLQKCFNVGMTRKHSKLGRKRKLEQDVSYKSPCVANLDILLTDEEMNIKIQNENMYFLREIGIVGRMDTDINNLSKVDSKSQLPPVNANKTSDVGFQSWYLEQELSYRLMPDPGIHSEDSYLFSPTLSKFWNPNGQNNVIGELTEEKKRLFSIITPLTFVKDENIEDLFIKINNFFYLMDSTDPEYLMFQKLRKDIPRAHMETCMVTEPIMENFYNYKYDDIPTDEDSDNVWKIILKEMDPITNNVISFCRKIPEFETVLPFADTANIIKLVLFEIISLRFLRLVDLENNQFFDPGLTRKIPSSVMAHNPLGPLFLRYFYVVAFIKKHLVQVIDDYEMAFMSALCLTLPGWDSSQTKFVNVAHLNRMRFFFSLCLYDHILLRRYKGNVEETRKRMRKLVMLLDKIKIVNKIQSDLLLYLTKNKKNIEKLPLILRQIYVDEFELQKDQD